MSLFADSPTAGELAIGQIAAAAVLGALGLYFLLPQPKGRRIPLGIFFSLAGLATLAVFLVQTYAQPTSDAVGQVLFWVFSAGALGFGAVLVAQRNPARGAIAFSFVILSTCGLFLLLAAPFLMAATIIIYAGAIIVTFLFVLMLSHANGPSSENDRTREPLLGSLAGFAFTGLVLFALYLSSPASHASSHELMQPPLTDGDRHYLAMAVEDLDAAEKAETLKELEEKTRSARSKIGLVVGFAPGDSASPGSTLQDKARPTVVDRLKPMESDVRVKTIIDRSEKLRAKNKDLGDKLENLRFERNPDLAAAKKLVHSMRDDVVLFSGNGHLPARNVTAIGTALYSEHLLAVEMAGTLLLVATIGAVAIAGRKGVTA